MIHSRSTFNKYLRCPSGDRKLGPSGLRRAHHSSRDCATSGNLVDPIFTAKQTDTTRGLRRAAVIAAERRQAFDKRRMGIVRRCGTVFGAVDRVLDVAPLWRHCAKTPIPFKHRHTGPAVKGRQPVSSARQATVGSEICFQ